MSRKESDTQTRVLGVAEDLVCNVTGLQNTLALPAHCIRLQDPRNWFSYFTMLAISLLQVDAVMAEKTLQAMDPETGAVTPPNFLPGRFTHSTCYFLRATAVPACSAECAY